MTGAFERCVAWFAAGGPVMWALLACSLLALTVALERCCFWARLGCASQAAACAAWLDALEAGADPGEPPAGPFGRMLAAGLGQPPQRAGLLMQAAALRELAIMRRGQALLGTIITAAPMLGILGTILGIMASFEALDAGGGEPLAVVGGIGQALITTAFGLIIAIGALIPHNFFEARLDEMREILEELGSRLEALAGRGA